MGQGCSKQAREEGLCCKGRASAQHSLAGKGTGTGTRRASSHSISPSKWNGPGGLSVALLRGEGFRKHTAGKGKDGLQEQTVIVSLSSSPTGKF